MNSFSAVSPMSGNKRWPATPSKLISLLCYICVLLLSAPVYGEDPGSTIGQQVANILDLAEKAYMELRFQEAVKLYTTAATHVPNLSSIYLGRGMAYEMSNHLAKAAEDYKTALRLDPLDYRAMENLAGIFERDGDKAAEASDLYQRALKLDPRPEWQESLAAWAAMLETSLRPASSSSVRSWHMANAEAGRAHYREAESLYGKALEINPVMYQAYFSRGTVRMQTGNLHGAIEDFSMTVRLSPGFRGAYVQRGLAHEQLGEMRQAREDMALAVKHDPRDPEARYRLGRVLQQQQDLAGALDQYKQALNLRPKPELRKDIQEQITAIFPLSGQSARRPRALMDILKNLW